MTQKAVGGYAVANDEAEHEALSEAGYEPKFVVAEQADEGEMVKALRAKLDAAGIKYHHNAGIEKLTALLPKE